MDHLAFFEVVERARTPSAVLALVARHARALGQDHVTLGGNVGSAFEDLSTFFFTTWPEALREEYEARALVHSDPGARFVHHSAFPAPWREIVAGRTAVEIGPEQRLAIAVGEDHGITGGLVVPIHGPGGYLALATFTGRADPPTRRERALLHMMGLYAHQRLFDLSRKTGAQVQAAPGLTHRERDAMLWLVAGETDEGIARRMGIAERTVRFHLDNVRRKLGARTRAQAVAKAVLLGLIDP